MFKFISFISIYHWFFQLICHQKKSPHKQAQADHHESSLCSFQAGEALNFATSTRAGVSSSMAVLGGTLGTTAGGICGALAGGAAGVVPRYILGRLGGHFFQNGGLGVGSWSPW